MAPRLWEASSEPHMLYARSAIGRHLVLQASIESIMPALATLSVMLRFFVRKKFRYAIKWDDIVIAFSLIFSWGLWAAWYWEVKYLVPTTLNELPKDKLGAVLKASFIQEFFYINGCNIVKIAVILFYFRALATTRKVRIALWILCTFVVLFTIGRFLAEIIFQCFPISYLWNKEQDGHCVNFHALLLSCQSINVFADVAVLVFPMPIVWSLSIPVRQKLALVVLFCLGGIACAASVVRVILIDTVFRDDARSLLTQDAIPKLLASAQVELNVMLICASLPAFRSPARTFARRWQTRMFGQPTPEVSGGDSKQSSSAGYFAAKAPQVNETSLSEQQMLKSAEWDSNFAEYGVRG